MQRIPIHQSDRDSELFGLLSSRSVHRENEPHMIRRDEVMAARGDNAPEELRADFERTKRETQSAIEEYNDEHEPPIELKINEPAVMHEQAKLQLQQLRSARQNSAEMSESAKAELDNQITFLELIQGTILRLNALKADMERVFRPGHEVDVEYANRSRLRRKFERLTAGQRTLETWKRAPLFEKIREHFAQVADNPEFEAFWQTEDGVEEARHTEAKQLFLSILSQETNGFNNPTFFGENFGENPEENIRNYPFIYNEWFKKHTNVSLESIQLSANQVADAREAVRQSARPISDIISVAGPDSGLTQNQIDQIVRSPEDQEAAQRADVLRHFIANLNTKAEDYETQNDADKAENYRQFAIELQKHFELAQAEYRYYEKTRSKEQFDRSFTRSYFAEPANQREAMELAMRKFKKAMEMVDHPMGPNGDWEGQYHPTVRRLLIATFYETGVSSYSKDREGNITFTENISEQKADMLASLARSEYFNTREIGMNMDQDHRVALKVIEYGFQVTDFLESTNEAGEVLDLYIAKKTAESANDTNEVERLSRLLSQYPPKYVAAYGSMRQEDLVAAKDQFNADRQQLERFLADAMTLLQNPAGAAALIEKYRANTELNAVQNNVNGIARLALLDGPTLANYSVHMQQIEADFNLQEHEDQNSLKFFERLGINLEGIHPLYQASLAENPDLSLENWDRMLQDPAQFDKLANFIESILPESVTHGKEDFMAAFRSLKGVEDLERYMQNGEVASDHAVAISVYTMIKKHLKQRQEVAGYSDAQQREIAAKFRGMHIGDHVSFYVGGVWDMLTGPGQSWANRGAGLVMLYGLYKSARMAMKGDTPAAKALRALFVGGAAEIAMKEITGRGLLDRAGVDLLEDAMEGTYEAVLVGKGAELMQENEITQREHELALQKMKALPFNSLMEWYDNTDRRGKLNQPDGRNEYRLPRGINPSDIVKGETRGLVDKNQRASLVLRKTIQNFFTYVGNKDNNRGHDHGLNVVRERWVTMIADPNHTPEYTEYWSKRFSDLYRGNQQHLTWEVVMRAEISPEDVERTKGQTIAGRAETLAVEAWDGATDWIRTYANKIEGNAEIFFDRLGAGARGASETLGGVAETLQTKLHFGAESVKLWYNAHEYTIKRVAEQHWELAVAGVTLPFKAIIGIDNFIIPSVLTKINQIENVLSYQQESVISESRPLAVTDIVRAGAVENSPNVNLNPEFSYFGQFQGEFRQAFENPSPTEHFWHMNPELKVGYFISEMTAAEAGVNMTDEQYRTNPENRRNAIIAKSREKAIQAYVDRGLGMTETEISQYLYPIHVVNKSSQPETMYVFWRLPMPGSAELALRQSGRWNDFSDPNRFKDRGAFELDPSKTKWENFAEAMSLDMDPVRGVISSTGAYAIQLPRFAFGTIEAAGGLIKPIATWMTGAKTQAEKDRINDAVEIATRRPESQRRWLDEAFTSARSTNLALSDFYRVPLHSKLFNFSLEFAHNPIYQGELFTGLLIGKKVANPDRRRGEPANLDYDPNASIYAQTENPAERYAKMMEYYTSVYVPTHGEDPEIRKEIEAKMRAPNPR